MSLRGITILVLVAAIVMVVPSAKAAEQKKSPPATPPGQKDASPSGERTPAKPTAPRPTITVKDGRLTAEARTCRSSGVATGVAPVMYLAANGCDTIYKYDRAGTSSAPS